MEPGEMRMKLLYGVNQADQCWDFAVGTHRDLIQSRLRAINTGMIRLFLFDKGGPDPVENWPLFVSYVEAVLNVGAVPMITFAKFHRPVDDPRAIRWFAEQCSDVVWGCIEQWGGENVRDWLWCVWNEPNSAWIGGGLSFEQYRRIYIEVAHGVLRWLGPHLGERKALIGGPAVEGFKPFWMDWVWRFVNEIDNDLISFVDWHHYGDWRDHGEAGAPGDSGTHFALLMSQTAEYESRARSISRLLRGRSILNICGELNTHSHYWTEVRQRFNETVFSGAFYVSSILHLIRGGADVEMFWTGTEDYGGYGMMNKEGEPAPVYHAKRLCAQYLRYGDWVSFPAWDSVDSALDVAVARADDGRRSALIVHRAGRHATYALSELATQLSDSCTLLKIDEGTGNRLAQATYDGTVTFDGYGVAVVTEATVPAGMIQGRTHV